MVSKRERGRLRAVNPSDNGVAPMTILGTCVLFLVFPSIDETFGVRVRVVEGLPVGRILGTAFMRRYKSTLDFGGSGSGWFRPTPTSSRMPLLPWLEPQREKAKAQEDLTRSRRRRTYMPRRAFNEWRPEDYEIRQSQPSEVLAPEALELGVYGIGE